MNPVTLETIARAAGVHRTTVSRALRNHPGIPPETRDRILKIAEQLGYRPNPLVSIYQAYVRAHRTPHYHANIAWIDDQPSPRDWLEKPWLKRYLTGAEQRAAELGYRIERIRLDEFVELHPEINVQRFCRILTARGIHGAILPRLTHPSLTTVPWTCAVVEIGRYETWLMHAERARFEPRTWHSVQPNLFLNVQHALYCLWQRGYRRPALVISRWYDRSQGFALRGGYLAEQFELPLKQRLPPFLFEEFQDGMIPELGAWLARWKPDAIICADARVAVALEQLGHRIPDTIGLAHLSLADDVKGWSGIDEQHELIGSAAVDIIVSQLEHNERGLPANPRCILIDGRWLDGSTTRTVG